MNISWISMLVISNASGMFACVEFLLMLVVFSWGLNVGAVMLM